MLVRMKTILAGIALLSLLLGGSTSAYAQVTTISGKFVDKIAGFEIDFPDGWNGIIVQQKHPVVSPTGIGTSGADVMMSVFIGDRLETRNLMSSEIDPIAGQAVKLDGDCESPVSELVKRSGLKVFHAVHQCNDAGGYSKINSYIFLTLTRAIVVSYITQSESDYKKYLADFESSVQTIKVNEPNDFRAGLELTQGINKTFNQKVMVESLNSEAELATVSSSEIDRLLFDEDGRLVTLTVNEQKRTRGSLIVEVDSVLAGPYTVSVDRKPAQDYIVIHDREAGEKLVYVAFSSGTHEIGIAGASVVPEFPVHLLGILAGVLSAAILAQRMMLRKKL